MKSVGDTLKSLRERKKLTVESVSQTTHIRSEYIRAIERNAFHVLPTQVAARGFITLYAQALGTPADTLLALYRRDVQLPPEYTLTPVKSSWAFWKNKRTKRLGGVVIIAGIICGFMLYAWTVVYRLSQAPALNIDSPKPNARLISPVTIRGTTLTDSVVMIDSSAIGVNQDGEFITQLELNPGPHVITVKAVGRNGKENIQTIEINVEETSQ